MLTLLMLAPAPGQAAPTAAPVPVPAASDPSYDDGPPPVKHQGSAQPGGSLQTGVNLNKIGDPVANAETPPPPDFSLTESSSSLTLLVGTGGSGSSTISVSPINGFNSDVTLGVSAGYGVTASLSQTTITAGSGTSTLNVTVAPNTPGGVYSVTVTGSGGGLTHSVTYTVYVTDFTLSAGSVTAPLGGSGTGTVTVTGLYGFSNSVSLSASGVPSGVSAAFSPASVSGSGSSTVTFGIGSSVPSGTYTVTITGTSGPLIHTTTLSLTVVAFSVSVSPTSLTAPVGGSGTTTVTVTGLYGFHGAVSLGTSNLPPSVSASFSPNVVTATGSSTLTLNIGLTTPSGVYALNVTGTYGGATLSVPITLTITKPVVHVLTGSWQPNPAAVGQTITSAVTTSVDNPYQTANGHSISQRWVWTTGGVYRSSDGTSGSFTAYSGNYVITWAQGGSTTTFTGVFSDSGYYIIDVKATLTYHDDTTNTDILTCSGDGYIGGSASDLIPAYSSRPGITVSSALRPSNAPATPAKGVPVVTPVSGLQYQDPSSGQFVAIADKTTLYVLKGTALTFKLVPNPTTATFPAGYPSWSGSSGAFGTGTTVNVPFRTASANATDYKTVVVYSSSAATDKGLTANMVVVDLAVKQVSFSGTGSHTVKNDLDGTPYSAPQWQDNSTPLNGIADDANDKDYPICFTRNTTASVAVLMNYVPALPTGASVLNTTNVQIKGVQEGAVNLSMSPTTASVDSSGVSVGIAAPVALSAPFPNTVCYYQHTLGFQWYYSPDNGVTWESSTVTTHQVYVTLGDPVTTDVYQSVLDIGCRNAKGKSTSSDVVDAIWSDFQGSLSGGVKNANGTPMKYWPDGYNTPAIFDTQVLISQAKGRCGAWSELFRDVLRAQSIGADIYGIDLSGAIKPAAPAPPGYPYYMFSNPTNGEPGDGFFTSPGHPAQGNVGPPVIYGQTNAGLPIQWFDHAVVELTPNVTGATPVNGTDSTSVYDPSYGYVAQSSTVAASQLQWETNSIPSFWSVYTDGQGHIQFASVTYGTVRNIHRIAPPYVTFTYDKHPQN